MKATYRNKDSSSLIVVIAILICIIGILYLTLPKLKTHAVQTLGTQQNAKLLDEQVAMVTPNKVMELGNPISIDLPRLGIDLPVKPGFYNVSARTWTIDAVHAFTMNGSKTPLIYAHNKKSLFGGLTGIAENEVLHVTNDKGEKMLFAYSGYKNVAPTDTSIIDVAQQNTLFLMTCTGAFNESRQILTFRYIGIDSTTTSSQVTS